MSKKDNAQPVTKFPKTPTHKARKNKGTCMHVQCLLSNK